MSDDLAQQLADGVNALRDGRPERAVECLGPVVDDDDLAASDDLRDIFARACSLYAQALLHAGRPSEARRPVRRALELLEAIGDTGGIAAVQDLQAQIAQAIADDFAASANRRRLRALAEQPVDQVLDGVEDLARHAPLLVERAAAALEVGRGPEAVDIARRAVDAAQATGDLRHEVLARLTWARADPSATAEQLQVAHQAADRHDDFTLVGAIARAAEELGHAIAPPDAP
jgi:tetratricopeptide (TPR) repeat protein